MVYVYVRFAGNLPAGLNVHEIMKPNKGGRRFTPNITERVDETTTRIFISGGRSTLIDSKMLPRVAKYRWSLLWGRGTKYYAIAYKPISRQHILLHRFIFGKCRDEIDHINGDSLDNRRSNLREATHRQNGWNTKLCCISTTMAKGVLLRPSGRWRARITYFGKRLNLGHFSTKEEASTAYWNKAQELFGEFARLS